MTEQEFKVTLTIRTQSANNLSADLVKEVLQLELPESACGDVTINTVKEVTFASLFSWLFS